MNKGLMLLKMVKDVTSYILTKKPLQKNKLRKHIRLLNKH